jgi:hypothetical protein
MAHEKKPSESKRDGHYYIKMRNPATFLLIVFAILPASGLSAYDLSPPKNETGWILKSSGKNYRTYYRTRQGSDTHEILLAGLADRKPAQVIAAITDYGHFPEFMPYVKYTRLIHSEQKSKDVFLNYVFTFLDIPVPLVSSRFYNLRYTDVYNYAGNPEMFRSDWALEKGSYRRLPTDTDIRGFVTNPENAIETTFNQGYFQIEPADVPGKTRITYYVWTNPGGSLPAGAVNIANRAALPGLLDAIEKRASKY